MKGGHARSSWNHLTGLRLLMLVLRLNCGLVSTCTEILPTSRVAVPVHGGELLSRSRAEEPVAAVLSLARRGCRLVAVGVATQCSDLVAAVRVGGRDVVAAVGERSEFEVVVATQTVLRRRES